MKIFYLFFIFYFFVDAINAQQQNFPDVSSGTKSTVFVSSDFLFASNALTYELAKTYFLNRFITDAMKDQVSKHLDDQNRLGGDFTTEIYYRHTPDTMLNAINWSWFTGIKNIDHVHSRFPRDLFEIYFRGNKNYAGKTADFSDFSYLLLKYQQVQFGLSKLIKKDSVSYEAGAAIGFNVGQQLYRFKSGKTDLFTEQDGTYLDVNSFIELHTSDSLHKSLGAFNGYGVSTDLFFKATIKEKHHFFFKISNLGFIRWNKRSVELKADTSFRFEGIDVSELFNLNDTVRTSINIDSSVVQKFLTNRRYSSYTLFLPAKLEISYKRPLGHRHMRAGIGANYIFNADYFPQVHLDFDFAWKKNLVGINFSYGGYTTFGTGIFYQHLFLKGYVVAIGSNYINSIFNLNDSRAQNVGVTIYRNF